MEVCLESWLGKQCKNVWLFSWSRRWHVLQRSCLLRARTGELQSIEITTQPTKTEYVAGEIFDPTGMVLSVTYQDKSTDTLTVESPSDVDFDDSPLVSGQTSVEITIGQATVTQAITVRTGVFIEAEDGIIDSTGADINTDSAEATGGAYVGDMKSGDTLSFQLRAEKAGTAEIVFRLASQYLKQDRQLDADLDGRLPAQ